MNGWKETSRRVICHFQRSNLWFFYFFSLLMYPANVWVAEPQCTRTIHDKTKLFFFVLERKSLVCGERNQIFKHQLSRKKNLGD